MKRRSLIKGLSAGLLAAPSIIHARGLSMLLGSPPSDSGGGPTPYVAKAVHFDQQAWLECSSITCTDNGKFSFAIWFNDEATFTGQIPFFVSDPNDLYNVTGIAMDDGTEIDLTNDDGSQAWSQLSGANFPHNAPGISFAPIPSSWYCIIGTMDASNRTARVYIGDIDITWSLIDQAGTDGFTMSINGKSFVVAGDTFDYGGFFKAWLGALSDTRIALGHSWLDNDNDIPLATRRLFINENGKPVDPAVATAVLGAPTVLFSGDAPTFPVNQGIGGTFTLTGTLTNASTSPSD